MADGSEGRRHFEEAAGEAEEQARPPGPAQGRSPAMGRRFGGHGEARRHGAEARRCPEIKGARPPLRGFTLSKAAWPWREGETDFRGPRGRWMCSPVSSQSPGVY